MQRAPGRAAHARLRRLRVLFGKEGLCARVSPAAGTDMELHHFTEPSTHFYSGPGSGMLAGTTRGEAQLQDFGLLVCSMGICGAAGLQDTSGAQGLTQQDASTS